MRAILVDAFGTIVETRPQWTEMREVCFREAIAGSGFELSAFFPAYDAERRRDHERTPGDLREFDFHDRFRRTFARLGAADPEALAATARDRYRAFQGRLVAPIGDAHAGLAELARLAPLCLVSNYPHGATLLAALERVGLAHHFRDFVVSGDVGWLKPSPRIFLEASRRMGCAPADCVMIGNDARDDVEGAAAAGMRALLVAYPRGSVHAVPPGGLAVAGDLVEAARILAARRGTAPAREP